MPSWVESRVEKLEAYLVDLDQWAKDVKKWGDDVNAYVNSEEGPNYIGGAGGDSPPAPPKWPPP